MLGGVRELRCYLGSNEELLEGFGQVREWHFSKIMLAAGWRMGSRENDGRVNTSRKDF